MFNMPTEATGATDYIVEFDYFLGTAFWNGDVTKTGLVISDVNDAILATFCAGPGATSGTTTACLYRVATAVDGDYTVYRLVRNKGVVVIVK